MNKNTHPEPWNLIPTVTEDLDERALAHAALDETLNLLDIALSDRDADLFVECDLGLCRVNVEEFEALEPRS